MHWLSSLKTGRGGNHAELVTKNVSIRLVTGDPAGHNPRHGGLPGGLGHLDDHRVPQRAHAGSITLLGSRPAESACAFSKLSRKATSDRNALRNDNRTTVCYTNSIGQKLRHF
jgi:hypothetical protein